MRLVWGIVDAVVGSTPRAQELAVTLDDDRHGTAIAYPALSGECAVGEKVLLNTTAVDLSLGTGGLHFVVARASQASGTVLDEPSGGHVMKLRYTPLQTDVIAVESPESEHHQVMRAAESLEGTPVVCCSLHSQVPLVAAAVKRNRPGSHVAYCMTDGAALPLGVSRVMAAAQAAGLVDSAITCGQSFGGDLEAVTLHSGLLAARHVLRADVVVVSIGPGVVGTATPFGHGGVAQGEAINAVAALGGEPVACLRLSAADARERHKGVSHHTLCALTRVATARAKVAMPSLFGSFSDAIEQQLLHSGVWRLHDRADSAEGNIEPPTLHGVTVTTMGRGSSDDPAFFAAAYAAGDIASHYVAP